jgi:hypothetical protein
MKTAMLACAVALGLAPDPDYAKLVVLPETASSFKWIKGNRSPQRLTVKPEGPRNGYREADYR